MPDSPFRAYKLPPNPGAVAPLRPIDWSRYRRDWLDDGTDCISSSFAEALRLQHGEDAPDLPDMEAAYRQWHPGWDDDPASMRLDWYWAALLSIDVRVEALHQLGDIVDQIVDRLDRGYFPTAWVYLWNGHTGQWFHHAIVAVDHYDNWIVFYDPQRGFGWEYDKTLFRQIGLDGATSGYAYAAFWEGVIQQPEEPMPIDRVAGVKTADTDQDITDLINESAEAHGLSPITLLALMIAESGLHTGVKARRENRWPDVSYGLPQQTVWTMHPDAGLPLTRGADRLVLDTPENRRIVRDWLEVPANAIPYAARHLARIAREKGETEPLRQLSRWNAPAWTLEQNETNQPASIRNYRNGLAAAETYRVREDQPVPTVQPPAGIVWKGSPNFEQGRGGHAPIAIVNHVAEGSLAGVDSWFGQTASQVSAHFCVGKGGEIHQYVRSSDTAWANGRLNRPNTAIPWIADAVNRGINPNRLTISIEREGFTGEPLTEPMYQSILALHRYLCGYWGIPADAHHIVGHRDLDSVTRANCPGPHFPWARLLDDLNYAAPEPPIITAEAALGEIWRASEIAQSKAPEVRSEMETIRRMVATVKGG